MPSPRPPRDPGLFVAALLPALIAALFAVLAALAALIAVFHRAGLPSEVLLQDAVCPVGGKLCADAKNLCRAAAERNEPPGRAARSANTGLSRRRCCFRADNTWCFILRSFLRRACGASGLLTKHFRLSIRYHTEGRRVNRRRESAAFFEKFCLTIAALRGSMLLQNKEGRRIRSHPQRSEGVNKRSEKRDSFLCAYCCGCGIASVFSL